MWLIEEYGHPESVHYLLCGPSMNVGRKGKSEKHISLEDNTVSNLHASFTLSQEEKNLSSCEILPQVLLVDLRSSNGTYIKIDNERTRVSCEKPSVLKNDDVIYFGNRSTWRLIYKPLVVTMSQIAGCELKSKIKKNLVRLGGHLVKEWRNECTLLLMNELVLTAKTVCALAACLPIVTPQFLADSIDAVMAKKLLPRHEDYVPPLKEPSLNSGQVSFCPDQQRKFLFEGKTFLFQSEASFKRMKSSVVLAGGVCELLSESNISKIVLPRHIFIKSSDKESSVHLSLISKIKDLLKENGLASIPESDIGLAVVYKSINRYCNPSFNVNGILRPQSYTNQSQNLVIYATETQALETQMISTNPVSRTTIVESGESTKSLARRHSFCLPKPPQIKAENGMVSPKPSTSSSIPQCSNVSRGIGSKDSYGKRKRLSNENEPCNKRLSRAAAVDDELEESVSSLAGTEYFAESKVNEEKIINFQPSSSSTQIDHADTSRDRIGTPSRGRIVDHGDPILLAESGSTTGTRKSGRNLRVAPQKADVETDLQEEDKSLNCVSVNPKSIPFDPYTLPSFALDDLPSETVTMTTGHIDESARSIDITSTSIKTELNVGAPLSNDDDSVETVVFQMPLNKEKKEGATNFHAALRGTCLNASDANENRGGAVNDEGDDFALPRTLEKRGRGRLRLDEPPKEEVMPETKRIKVENEIANQPPQRNVDVITSSPINIKRRISDAENSTVQNNENMNSEGVICPSIVVKKEDHDMEAISDRLEKSLIVVKVVSLVKRVTQLTPSVSGSSNGLPNFKKFKKVLPYSQRGSDGAGNISIITPLPHIIGGRDLVFHTEANLSKESFLQSQMDLQSDVMRREAERQERNDNDKFDSDFNLVATRKKRGRIW